MPYSRLTALKQVGLKYYRLEPKLTYSQSQMDNIDPNNIQSLMTTTKTYLKGEGAAIIEAVINELQSSP